MSPATARVALESEVFVAGAELVPDGDSVPVEEAVVSVVVTLEVTVAAVPVPVDSWLLVEVVSLAVAVPMWVSLLVEELVSLPDEEPPTMWKGVEYWNLAGSASRAIFRP